ncbi:NACHT domain-containing protein [Paenibacillus sp. FSL R5-0517]|uniref:NACHT domain-containing protein n=1 Tax=Paenibacillus sp. FSL R5-0517 TaxID=2921647 RepID=UPI0030DAA213
MIIVDDIIVSGLVNVTCTFITDIFKSYNKRPWDKTIIKDVNTFIHKYTDTELDSGAFCDYLMRTETTMNLKEYIKYSATSRIYKVRIVKKNYRTNLNKQDFLGMLSSSAINYVKEVNGKVLSSEIVTSYFKDLMDILENKLIEKLDTPQLGSLYFLNQSMQEMELRIINSLNRDIYIDNSQNYEKTREKYIRLIKLKNKKSHVYGLKELEMYSFYVFPEFELHTEELSTKHKINVSWEEIFKESNEISIIGGAGLGKSLFLKNLMNKYEELNILNSKDVLPIYCDLKQYKQFGKNSSSYSIDDYLVDSIINHTGIDRREITKDFINYFMNAGRCLILFDALDEVDSHDRNDLNSMIMSYFQETNKHNKICLTSRAQGFISKTRITYSVSSVTPTQIYDYLDNMCKLGLFSEDYIEGFMEKCNTLIRSRFLLSLLQVSLLINIYKAELELPENKIDLYDKCIEYISKKREFEKKKTEFDFGLISSILDSSSSFEKLASLAKPNNIEIHESTIHDVFSKMFQRSYGNNSNSALNATKEFLKFCSLRTELYVVGSQDYHYKFFHRSFFEYFYSKHLIKVFPENENLIEELYIYDIDSEVFELTAAILKKHDYDRYTQLMDLALVRVKECLNNINSENESKILKLCLLINASVEKYYLGEIQKLLFSEKRELKDFKNEKASDVIVPIVLKNEKEEAIKNILKYYNEEIFAGKFMNYMIDKIISSRDWDKNLNFSVELNSLFIRLSMFFQEEEIVRATKSNDLSFIESLVYRYIKFSEGQSPKYVDKSIKSYFQKINKPKRLKS